MTYTKTNIQKGAAIQAKPVGHDHEMNKCFEKKKKTMWRNEVKMKLKMTMKPRVKMNVRMKGEKNKGEKQEKCGKTVKNRGLPSWRHCRHALTVLIDAK